MRDVARVRDTAAVGRMVEMLALRTAELLNVSSLGNDYYQHNEQAHALVGSRTGEGYRLGDIVEVKLMEAIPSAGALRFEMLTPGRKGNFGSLKSGLGRKPPRNKFGVRRAR